MTFDCRRIHIDANLDQILDHINRIILNCINKWCPMLMIDLVSVLLIFLYEILDQLNIIMLDVLVKGVGAL